MDRAGQLLEPVPTPAATTFAGIARRFTGEHLAGIETAVGQVNTRMVRMVGQVRRSCLLKVATIDGDTTDVEVCGRTKEHAQYNHTGQRNLRPHIAFWAEAGVPLAAELMAGAGDPRSNSVAMLDRAIAALPEGVQQVRARWDAGYFAKDLAAACVARGIEFAIGAKRTAPVFAAAARIGDHEWVPAIGMEDTELAVIDYLPGQWPTEGVVCIARRTRIPVEAIPTGRARKRRTIPKDQLTLALGGGIDHVFGYSFILTNLDVGEPEQLAEVEWWYRHRTDIEALNKDAKHGAALIHLPSKYHAINAVWMWGALLACAISAWLQEITGIDRGNGRGRRTLARLRRDLINVPACNNSSPPSYPACNNSPAPADPHAAESQRDGKDPKGPEPPPTGATAGPLPCPPQRQPAYQHNSQPQGGTPSPTRRSGSERQVRRPLSLLYLHTTRAPRTRDRGLPSRLVRS